MSPTSAPRAQRRLDRPPLFSVPRPLGRDLSPQELESFVAELAERPGFHDHDGSAGAVAVVSGAVREERRTITGEPRDRTCVLARHSVSGAEELRPLEPTG